MALAISIFSKLYIIIIIILLYFYRYQCQSKQSFNLTFYNSTILSEICNISRLMIVIS